MSLFCMYSVCTSNIAVSSINNIETGKMNQQSTTANWVKNSKMDPQQQNS
ncbi:hypothetical protein Hanom_Chr14g01253301 [Helianthus anomalus]